jgi:hypothetical protein
MKTEAKRNKSLRCLCLLFCTLWPLYGSAQTADTGTQQAQRKVGTILKEIKKTETAVNKLFNQLNSSDDFDLVCYAYEQTGSKARQRICEPLFMKKARNAEASRFVNGTRQGTDTSVPQGDGALQALLQDEIVGLSRELQEVAKQSPEFAAQLQQLQALVREYAVHDKARSNDPALGFLSRFMQRSSVN